MSSWAIIRGWLLGLCCLGMTTAAFANTGELTLKEVLYSAARSHPKMTIAETLIDEAEGRALEADGGFDLKLYASGQTNPVGYYERSLVDIGVSQPTPFWGTELSAGYKNGLNFPPYDGGNTTSHLGKGVISIFVPLLRDGAIDGRRLERILAGLQAKIAHQERRALRAETLADAARSYFKWALLGAEANATRSLLELAEKRQELLEEQVLQGQMAPIELIDNRRVVATRRAGLHQAELTLRRSALELSLYLRRNGKRREVLDSQLPRVLSLPPRGFTLERHPDLVALTPEVEIHLLGLELLGEEIRLAQNRGLPRLDLSFELTHSGGTERAYSDLDTSISETTLGGRLGLSLDAQRRKARGKLAQLHAKRRALQHKLELTKDTLAVLLQGATQSLESSRSIAEESGAARRGAEEMAEAERERLGLGQSNVFNLNLREEAVQSARMAELKAIVAVHLAWIDLQEILGRDSVEAYLGPEPEPQTEVLP